MEHEAVPALFRGFLLDLGMEKVESLKNTWRNAGTGCQQLRWEWPEYWVQHLNNYGLEGF